MANLLTRTRKNDLYNPLRILDRFFKEEDLFSSLVDELSHFHGLSHIDGVSRPDFSPNLDLSENKDNYIVSLEIPGMTKNEVNIEVSDNVLIITGEKKEDKSDESKGYIIKERYYGTFRREISLESDCDPNNISAKYTNGTLAINIPKIKEKEIQKKKIEILE